MKTLWALAGFAMGSATALMACGEAPGDANPDYLLLNPEHLAQLRVQCRMDPTMHSEAVCRAVAEATRRRFMGEGTPYTPARPPADPALPADPAAPGGRR